MSGVWDMFRVTVFGSDNSASRTGAEAFDPERDIPSLAGKIILITGAAGDLGRQTTIDLIRYGKPKIVYIADLPRSEDEKQAVLDDIRHEAYGVRQSQSADTAGGDETSVRYLDLDLGSFESIRKCARQFLDDNARLDVLICNAGIIRMTPGTTTDGYEVHFGINYLGHALLVRLLVPLLLETAEKETEAEADVRIVIVSSEGHVFASEGGVEFDVVKTDGARMVRAFSLLI
jgi:NAD(P)-dependent dehydrogenase (short-subunit alcohol dehydrogenase family)